MTAISCFFKNLMRSKICSLKRTLVFPNCFICHFIPSIFSETKTELRDLFPDYEKECDAISFLVRVSRYSNIISVTIP